MKLFDYILLAIAFAFLFIGIDQVIRANPNPDNAAEKFSYYWIFMVVAVCLIWLNFRKFQHKNEDNAPDTPKHTKKNPGKSRQK